MRHDEMGTDKGQSGQQEQLIIEQISTFPPPVFYILYHASRINAHMLLASRPLVVAHIGLLVAPDGYQAVVRRHR